MGRAVFAIMAVWLALAALAAPAAAQDRPAPTNRFEGWTTAVISADWRDGRGRPIQAFDNARRDLVRGFLDAGLPRAGMVDFSLRPDPAAPEAPRVLLDRVGEAAAANPAGCLIYFTSHGSPTGMAFGETGEIAPDAMLRLVQGWCGTRPTVVVISACFSGAFVNALRAPNRMVLTASSRDRASFGCGADDRHPWFDGCVLEALPAATDFLALAAGARACVTRKETERGAPLPSEPQLFVGADMQMRLPTLRFARRAP